MKENGFLCQQLVLLDLKDELKQKQQDITQSSDDGLTDDQRSELLNNINIFREFISELIKENTSVSSTLQYKLNKQMQDLSSLDVLNELKEDDNRICTIL